ncbi:hypothetical protein SUGI_0709880 [Cryptomeria japonica]|nr:hypothetical protein SUGI_0709880 [Cryptomeria japonica]
MASEREMFKHSGPCYLTHVDWRCIAASLVQGVYAQEWERQERRLGPDAQAEIWWSFFGFKLLRPLLDRVDGSIFGAVYKWSKKAAQVRFRPPGVPKIVVALRGTVPKAGAVARDLWLDLSFLTNELHTSYRFHYTLDVVKKSVRKHGSENVWIVGHSLGAAMGMLAGRKMAEEERQFLQAHLFNPPFVSPPVERIQNEKIKSGFYIARSVDYVSSGYVGYFANQQVMQRMGAGGIAKLSAHHSISDIVLSALGRKSKAGHLIPCASLIINLSASANFMAAHGINQWWASDIRIECTEYRLVPAEETLQVQPKTALRLRAHI